MTEHTKQLLDRAAQYLAEPYHPITDDKYKVGVGLITDLSRELAATTEPKIVRFDGSPIRKAVRDLRDAIDNGEGWRTICKADEALDHLIAESNDRNLVTLYNNLFAKLQRQTPTDWDAVNNLLNAIEYAVTSPTPDLSARIQAAAEEITGIGLDCRPEDDDTPFSEAIAAIITRHIEGKVK